MPPSVTALVPNSTFGPYRIVRQIGKGTFGSVYEALRMPVGKRVALKLLDPKLATRPEAVARFEREAYATASLDHPNIVTVFDVGEEQGFRFLAMEFLDGETLEARLEREGVLSSADVAEIFLPLLSGLARVHEHGFIHRDLKPANVFLVQRAAGALEPKLLDFGMVKPDVAHGHAALTRKGSLLGSPAYMSPEQAETRGVDVRSDLFSMGSILWECTAGRRLFMGSSLVEVLHAVVNAPITPPNAFRSTPLGPVDAIVCKALQRDPSHRFQSAREMGRALSILAPASARDRWIAEFGTPVSIALPTPPSVIAEAVAPAGSASIEATTAPLGSNVPVTPASMRQAETVPLDLVRPSNTGWLSHSALVGVVAGILFIAIAAVVYFIATR